MVKQVTPAVTSTVPTSTIEDDAARAAIETLNQTMQVRNGQTEQRHITAAELMDPATTGMIVASGLQGAITDGEGGGIKEVIDGIEQAIIQTDLWQDLGTRLEWINYQHHLNLDGVARLRERVDLLRERADAFFIKLSSLTDGITREMTQRLEGDEKLIQILDAYKVQVGESLAGIINELEVRASADEAFAQQITGIGAKVGENTAAILEEKTVRANADSAMAQVVSGIDVRTGQNTAAILEEKTVRANADSAMAQVVSGIDVRTGQNTAAILTESQARTNADKSLASSISTLTTQTGNNLAAIQTQLTAITTVNNSQATQINTLVSDVGDNKTFIERVDKTYADKTTAIATQINTLSSAVNNNAALVQNFQTTQTNVNTSVANQFTQLQTKVDDSLVMLREESSVRAEKDGKLEAQYTVKVDVNGYVSGFGLASTANNSTPYSDFIVRANRFAIGSPSGPGIQPVTPFIVLTTTDAAGNPPGVYMRDAFIQNLTVDTLKIKDNAVSENSYHALTASFAGTGYDQALITVHFPMKHKGWLYVITSGYVGYGSGWANCQTKLFMDGKLMTSGGGDEAWTNATHMAGLYVTSAKTVEVKFVFWGPYKVRVYNPSVMCMATYK